MNHPLAGMVNAELDRAVSDGRLPADRAAALGTTPKASDAEGTTPAGDPQPEPKAEPKSSAPEPAPSAARGDDPPANSPADKDNLLAGKYKSADELAKGYSNLLVQSTTISAENQKLRDQLAALQSQPAPTPPASDDRMTPGEPAWKQDFEPTIKRFSRESAIPEDVVTEFVGELVSRQTAVTPDSIRKIVQESFAPYQAQAAAEQYVRETYPDMIAHAQEIAVFAESAPPVIKDGVRTLRDAGNLSGAYDYLIRAYRENLAGTSQAATKQAADDSAGDIASRRAAASSPGAPSSTPPHGAVSDGKPTQAELAALAVGARNGNANAGMEYRRKTILSMPGLKEQLERVNAGLPVRPQ